MIWPVVIILLQSTLPVWGATSPDFDGQCPCLLQSTLPVWGATALASSWCGSACDFNPRSPYGERLRALRNSFLLRLTSIHAPRMGSDNFLVDVLHLVGTSIHAPRMGSDDGTVTYSAYTDTLQSTLPVWGATLYRCCPHRTSSHFNPRSPYGERQQICSKNL